MPSSSNQADEEASFGVALPGTWRSLTPELVKSLYPPPRQADSARILSLHLTELAS